tara:strand:+ start:212 stop:580 length:369 start_codon:yes stop_codon:yes gene_type:complete
MAIVGEWVNDKLEIDMTGNSDASVDVIFGNKLKKFQSNSFQIIGVNLGGTVAGTFKILVGNLFQNDTDFSKVYLDQLGNSVDIISTFSEMYQTAYAYNTVMANFENIGGITSGKFIIALNRD